VDETHKLLEDMAHQPIQYWAAALVLGSLVVGYISVRKLVNTLREQNQELRELLKERDERLKELNNKVLALLEEQRRRRSQ
jgi:uncharacterized membrane-anchored protein YhcB (DUF1043 family)